MPVDPNAAALAAQQMQMRQMLQQAMLQGQLQQQQAPMMMHPSLGAGTGTMGMQGLPPVNPAPPMPQQNPQTLGINQPIPMQLPQADPQGQQQGQAPDISYGMSLGDIPSMG